MNTTALTTLFEVVKSKAIKLPIAVYLDEEETKLIGDKNSTVHKMVAEILDWFKSNTGVVLNVICTEPNGKLYKIKF